MKVVITRKIYEQIRQEAQDNPHKEICGLGFANGDGVINNIHKAMNVSTHDLAEYQFSPDDFGMFLKYHTGVKDDKKLKMIYHSHPKWTAFPSSQDIRKAYKQYYYLIYSNVEDLARVFKVDENSVDDKKILMEIPLEIVDA